MNKNETKEIDSRLKLNKAKALFYYALTILMCFLCAYVFICTAIKNMFLYVLLLYL